MPGLLPAGHPATGDSEAGGLQFKAHLFLCCTLNNLWRLSQNKKQNEALICGQSLVVKYLLSMLKAVSFQTSSSQPVGCDPFEGRTTLSQGSHISYPNIRYLHCDS